MKITNTSDKLSTVLGYTMLPGDSVHIPDEQINAPVYRCAEMGLLRLEDDTVKEVPKKEEKVVKEVEIEPTEVEEKKTVKRTRTKK